MNVKIRPITELDAKTSVHWRNDKDVWVHTAFSANQPVTEQAEIAWAKESIGNASSRRFAIIADDVYVGNVNLTHIENGEAEYSIFIGNKAFWGKGIAKKASIEVLNYAKRVLSLESVRLGVSEKNAAAVKIYKSLGFVKYSEDERFTWMRLFMKDWVINEEV